MPIIIPLNWELCRFSDFDILIMDCEVNWSDVGLPKYQIIQYNLVILFKKTVINIKHIRPFPVFLRRIITSCKWSDLLKWPTFIAAFVNFCLFPFLYDLQMLCLWFPLCSCNLHRLDMILWLIWIIWFMFFRALYYIYL